MTALSRREMVQLLGVGAASAAALSPIRSALAQAQEEAQNDPLTIVRKGIDNELQVISADLLEAEAKTRLSEGVYVFISHGAGEQWTLRENRRAFGDYVFQPHRMGGIVRTKIDTSITMLGETLPHPIFVTPMGSHGLVHPEAEVATARGAAKSGGLLSVSSASTAILEDIGKASSTPKWFQMYLNGDAGISRELLQRVKPAGFKAIILTVDAIGQGSSDEYVRLGRPRPWLPYGNFTTGSANAFKTDLSWADLEFTATASGLPVVIKGITRPDDAVAARKAGAAAIQVSNHGGRALDGTPGGHLGPAEDSGRAPGRRTDHHGQWHTPRHGHRQSPCARRQCGGGRETGVVGADLRRPGRCFRAYGLFSPGARQHHAASGSGQGGIAQARACHPQSGVTWAKRRFL